MNTDIIPAKLAGRCSDGWERGQGVRVHALAVTCQPGDGVSIYGTALCKAEPGRRSVGWTMLESAAITCPRCLKKLQTMEKKNHERN